MLPKASLPVYTVLLPSTDEEIKFKPWRVSHLKSLLIAHESNEQDVMLDTIKDVVASCLVSKHDVNKMAIFDLEYLFIQIRAKSVGEVSELIFSCDVCESETARIKISFNLTNMKVVKNENHTKRIPLFDDVGVVMKYPSFKLLKMYSDLQQDDYQLAFDMIIESIDYVYDKNEIHSNEDTSKEELESFLNDLTDEMLSKIMVFFETMPKLSQRVQYKCPECGLQHDKVMEGIEHFF